MEFTRRGRAVAALGLALVATAPLLAAPELVWAAAGVGALLLAVAVGFVRRIAAQRDALEVTVDLDPREPVVDGTSTATLQVERPAAGLPLRVVLPRPAAADGDAPLAVELDTHERAGRREPLTWPIAGTYRLGPPRVATTDRLGLFRAAFEVGDGVTVEVRPRRPEVRVGSGGRASAGAFGDHRTTKSAGGGVVAGTPEPYQPGMPVGRIDWKATARTDDVYVVEPEAETDRRTLLLVDHRAGMGLGEAPATPLGFARHVALSIARSARAASDPLGCVAVGDDGVTRVELPDTGTGQYEAIEALLRDLEPTVPERQAPSAHAAATGAEHRSPSDDGPDPNADVSRAIGDGSDANGGDSSARDGRARRSADEATVTADGSGSVADATGGAVAGGSADVAGGSANGAGGSANGAGGSADVAGDPQTVAGSSTAATGAAAGASVGATAASVPTRAAGPGPTPAQRDPAFARRAADALAGEDDAFARTLRPFFDGESTYQTRVDDEPLAAAARAYLPRVRGSLWTVVLTDDARPAEVRKTVRLARRGGDRVLVLLAPRVCYEAGELADLEDAAARYRAFDEFRRELARMDRVEALEVAPGDRLEDVLASVGDGA